MAQLLKDYDSMPSELVVENCIYEVWVYYPHSEEFSKEDLKIFFKKTEVTPLIPEHMLYRYMDQIEVYRKPKIDAMDLAHRQKELEMEEGA